MKCEHDNDRVVDLGGHYRWRLDCEDCGASITLGPSNDAIPEREMRLARYIAGIHACELGEYWTLDDAIRLAVNECAEM